MCCRYNGTSDPTVRFKLNLSEPLREQVIQQAAQRLNYAGPVDLAVPRLYCAPHGAPFDEEPDLVEKDDLIYVAFNGEDWVSDLAQAASKRQRTTASLPHQPQPTEVPRILVAVCNPRMLPLPNAPTEAEQIMVAWKPAADSTHGNVAFCGVDSPLTTTLVQDELERFQPHIVQFIVHTGAGPNNQLDLAMQDEHGNVVRVDAKIIADLLSSQKARENLKLVVLNGCSTADSAVWMCRHGVYSICWDSLAADGAAMAFSGQLHKYLAQHTSNIDEIEPQIIPGYQSAWLHVRSIIRTGTGHGTATTAPPKWAFADPAAHEPSYRTVEGSSCAGTVLLIRPSVLQMSHLHRVAISQPVAAEEIPQSFPLPRRQYISHQNETLQTYAGSVINHARKILLRERYTFNPPQTTGNVVMIQGPSGVGTTALAIELAHDPQVHALYHDICWLDARVGTDEERTLALARTLSASQGNGDLRSALNGRCCLIILDGVTQASQVTSILDATSSVLQTVLATVRSLDLAREFELDVHTKPIQVRDAAPLNNIIRVPVMTSDDAQKLLRVLLPNATWQVQVQEHGDELINACEFLPRGLVEATEWVRSGRLTVQQAASYVRETGGIRKLFSSTLTRSWERDWEGIHLTGVIGQGYTGVVHTATCTELPSVDLAAKVMKPDASDSEQYKKFIKMLRLEVQALALINHPNVVRMYGVSINEPQRGVCLLMERIPMGSLRSVLQNTEYRNHILTDRGIQYKLTRGIVRAMSFLHSRHPRSVLHHDLKSDNVLVEDGFIAKLCDFGMVTGIGTTTLSITTTSNKNRSGTLLYGAPEFLTAGPEFVYLPSCEVWAFALIAWELLTGKHPFSHLAMPSLAVLTNYVNGGGRPESPTDAQLVDRDFLWQTVQKAWAQSPDARPTFQQLSSEFDAHATSYDVGARDWNLVKQCVVRVGVYSRTAQRLLDVGSGTIVTRAGHVLTAAHVLIDHKTLSPKQGPPPLPTDDVLYPDGNTDVVVLIGVYEDDSASSRWKYWATVKTPYSMLKEKFPGKSTLLDLAILEIKGTANVSPDVFMHTTSLGVLADQYALLDTPLVSAPQTMEHFLTIGDATKVQTGELLPCLGWPTPHGQTTIFVADDHSLLSKENGFLKSQAFMHSAMSGGPMLNWMKQVVGVNSQSWPDPAYGVSATGTLIEAANYAGWGRSVEYLRHEHWG